VSNVTEALERIELGSDRPPPAPRGEGRDRERARVRLIRRLHTFQPLMVGTIGSIPAERAGTIGSMDYDGRRPRVPVELAKRIDGIRGQVPFERWVREALEAALSEAKGPPLGEQAGPGPVGSSEPVRPAAPPRAPEPEAKPYELPKIAKRKW
jgi:hypothetical protein